MEEDGDWQLRAYLYLLCLMGAVTQAWYWSGFREDTGVLVLRLMGAENQQDVHPELNQRMV